MLVLMAILTGCSGDGDKAAGDDTGGFDTTDDTGLPLDNLDRRAHCSGMDPADPAPLGGWAAMTFDDGPDPEVTPQILATLRKYNVPATFFVLGAQLDDPDNADLIAEMIADPLFELANHSYDHPDFTSLSDSEARNQIGFTQDALDDHAADVDFFRFPYGSADCELADMVRDEYGLLVAGWHIDTADWCYAATGGTCTPDDYWRIPSEYQSDMHTWTMEQLADFDGGVLLYHDVHQYTADELEGIIVAVQSAGYTFTQLSDTEAFPRLNTDDPYDFPWVGEACSVSDDTCWQVEYLSWCEPTGDPDNADAGMCVLDCTESRCIDRDGVSPLMCADVAGQGVCLPYYGGYNDFCTAIPGTVVERVDAYGSNRNSPVCLPSSWEVSR